MTLITPFSINCKTVINFGLGAHQSLGDHVPNQAKQVVLVKGVSDQASAPVRAQLISAGINVTTIVCRGEPTLATVNAAFKVARQGPVDCIIACGGGAAIDSAKALRATLIKGEALTDDDFNISHNGEGFGPLIVLPTTAGTGSEVTRNAVMGAAQSKAKVSLRGHALQPDIAIVDPDLMRGAPKSVVLFSGLDAVVQNIEAYTSAHATPFTRALSGPAIASGLSALRSVIEADNVEAWSQLAWCSLASGIALANGGLGAAHGLASILGARYEAPHGALCGRLLASVIRANLRSAKCCPEIHQQITLCQSAISDSFAPSHASDPMSGFEDWISLHGLPRLAHWGVQVDQIDGLAEASKNTSSSLKNAVKLEEKELAQVLHDAL